VGLASRGQRDMDSGAQAIADSAELTQVRRQARKVHVEALLVAVVLTVGVLAIPAAS
jgi:hypothetical protein